MKKTFLSILLMAASIAATAQTLIKANFQEGDTTIYATVANITVNSPQAGQTMKSKIEFNTRYAVNNVTADSIVIESLITDFNVSGDEQAAGEIAQLGSMMENFKIVVSTDAYGKLRHIINMEEVNAHAQKHFNEFVDKVYAEHPEMAQYQPKEKMLETLTNLISEEALLSQMKENGIFALYGKTLKTGDTEAEEAQGIKYNTTYTVTPLLGKLTVVSNSVSNMTAEETKAVFFAQLEKAGLPEEQISMIKQSYDQMVAMGITKLDMKNNATYLFGKNSWVQEVKVTQTGDAFGQNLNNDTATTLKYANRK